MSRTTIAEIAASLGVSVPTVSKVLNGRSDVAPGTRARVDEALKRHNYRRSVSPTARKSGLLDLVFRSMDNMWAHEIMLGVEEAASARRLSVVVSELRGAHRPPQRWLDGVMSRRPVGVILALSTLEDEQREQLLARSIPFVVVDTEGQPPVGVPTVGSTNWDGGLAATRHLLELGHRRIGVISGAPHVLCSRARVDGYRSAHDEAGITPDPALIRWGDFTAEGGYQHATALLALEDPPTAIFAGSDHQALGVQRAAHEAGMRLPQDLSIVGYDDLPMTAWLSPPLTTVRQPLREMGALATRMVLSLAEGKELVSMRMDLATELVIRESTMPTSP
ncbi:LacI family DNA-binding transcriptional regulator [Tessaracoccus antarcticus]|uniref:LacI family transcriptional regulator n=1 Tax=Tessaracoccus antarcticus TaxID=2479848 RepID=A0A3M0GL76_9ACTN|nr:LacI family DNA-binding transcriptional regulator [Tessaracoccus antarcticus]RMB61899.1 LacI family transcriptional regulator [Tessaracoccus antarcticus]